MAVRAARAEASRDNVGHTIRRRDRRQLSAGNGGVQLRPSVWDGLGQAQRRAPQLLVLKQHPGTEVHTPVRAGKQVVSGTNRCREDEAGNDARELPSSGVKRRAETSHAIGSKEEDVDEVHASGHHKKVCDGLQGLVKYGFDSDDGGEIEEVDRFEESNDGRDSRGHELRDSESPADASCSLNVDIDSERTMGTDGIHL